MKVAGALIALLLCDQLTTDEGRDGHHRISRLGLFCDFSSMRFPKMPVFARLFGFVSYFSATWRYSEVPSRCVQGPPLEDVSQWLCSATFRIGILKCSAFTRIIWLRLVILVMLHPRDPRSLVETRSHPFIITEISVTEQVPSLSEEARLALVADTSRKIGG